MILEALNPGDVLLVKASRAVQAERIIECMKKRKAKRAGKKL
jgi:UDP-N-acetylmuramyl pentapeptide synthase